MYELPHFQIMLTMSARRQYYQTPSPYSSPPCNSLRFRYSAIPTRAHVHPAQRPESPPHLPLHQHHPYPCQRPRFSLPVQPPAPHLQSVHDHLRHHPSTLPRMALGPRAAGVRLCAAAHQHVPPLRCPAHRRQHAFPVDLRRQRGGLLRPLHLFILLSVLWNWFRPAARRLQHDLGSPGPGSQRGNFRGNGRLPDPLSAVANPDPGLRFSGSDPRSDYSRPLVHHAIHVGVWLAWFGCIRRRGLVGPRWRILVGYVDYDDVARPATVRPLAIVLAIK